MLSCSVLHRSSVIAAVGCHLYRDLQLSRVTALRNRQSDLSGSPACQDCRDRSSQGRAAECGQRASTEGRRQGVAELRMRIPLPTARTRDPTVLAIGVRRNGIVDPATTQRFVQCAAAYRRLSRISRRSALQMEVEGTNFFAHRVRVILDEQADQIGSRKTEPLLVLLDLQVMRWC